MNTYTLKLEPLIHLDEQNFFAFCVNNPDAFLELTATGELVIMSPTGAESSSRNSSLTAQLWNWNDQSKLGRVFDSNSMFQLPNRAFRSLDVAWMTKEKWQTLTTQQKETFPFICPDFVVELRSKSDTLKSLQEKMLEYRNNGVRLGWLIDPQNETVEIYRQGQEKEIVQNPTQLSGEDVLPRFILDMKKIYE